MLEIQSYLESKLKHGMNRVGGVEIVLDYDDERNPVLTTDGNYLQLYCYMVKEDMDQNQAAVQAKMDERKRLTTELMGMMDKDQYIIDSYNERIGQLSKEIAAATDAPKFMEWWDEVYAEVELLRQQQATVKKAIEQGGYIQKAEAIRSLIDRIEYNFVDVPTTDGRYKSGFKAVCQSVTIHSKATAKATDGQPIPTMTIETPPAWSLSQYLPRSLRWALQTSETSSNYQSVRLIEFASRHQFFSANMKLPASSSSMSWDHCLRKRRTAMIRQTANCPSRE